MDLDGFGRAQVSFLVFWGSPKIRDNPMNVLKKRLLGNFNLLILGHLKSYRHEAKNRNRYHLGESFEGKITWIKRESRSPRRKN